MSRALSLAGVLLGVALFASPTLAQPHGARRADAVPKGPVFITSADTGDVLDVEGRSLVSGTSVIGWERHPDGVDATNQLWRFVPAGHGEYYIESVMHGMVLDVQGANAARGSRIVVWPKQRSRDASQRWRVTPTYGGFTIVSALDGLPLSSVDRRRDRGSRIVTDRRGADLWRFERQRTRPAPPVPTIRVDVEAGPIWNQTDAERKCPTVCQCERPAPVKHTIEAGPIWNQADAERKCPATCGSERWTGAWRTTVPGRMSICECER